ncbi:MAG: hypothetical protein ABSE57_03945 [Bryobacteraceae bacterium]
MKTRPIFLRGYPRNCSKSIKAIERRLAALKGRSIDLRFFPALTADGRRLYSNRPNGQPVYAGSFIRKRQIVLDQELQRRPKELARILVHELFHFVWVRLGNPARRSYEDLVREEWQQRARGELGWSAELRKRALLKRSPREAASAPWRDYLCESFCDTGAWIYSGVRRHPEYTLAARHRDRRAEWFHAAFGSGTIPI